ncbi:MAG: tetratricopeptide repeat protein [Pirellulaceae bacterium]
MRPGEGDPGGRLPSNRLGEGGAGTRWNPGDRGTLPERQQDLSNRFNDLDAHWGDSEWAHQQWEGPNGDMNHFGFWGPNGYWGHTGVNGPNGGHWGHTGHVGPNGAWGHTGYFGPAGHWSRSWGWYNGYSPNWGHGRWDYLWNEYPAAMAFGATMWGVNVVDYMFGVDNYYNPYYEAPVSVNNQVVVSYSEPLVGDPSSNEAASDAEDSSPEDTDTDPLTETFDQARQAFQEEQFEQALQLTDQALALAPKDAAINEFRGLCLFALGRYREAAATIHAVLAAGPGWDWTTLISLYGNPATYTAQLRKLESVEPAAADIRFLLGYHYLTAGHQQEAVDQWEEVVREQPKDKLTAQLVQMYEPASEPTAQEAAPPKPDLQEPAYPLEKLQGNWAATAKGGQFSLGLNEDDSFTWSFTRDDKPQSVTGVYAIRGDNLVMQPDSGGTMLSTIKLTDDRTLEFTPIGDANELTFKRQ